MVTLASGIVLCGGTSVEDVHLLKARRREFMGWDAEELIGQERGEVTLAFSECADPAQRGQAVAAVMRPTCIHAIAQKHGGPTEAENLALSCALCNKNKGSDIASLDSVTEGLAPAGEA